jgi:glycosyltransferase
MMTKNFNEFISDNNLEKHADVSSILIFDSKLNLTPKISIVIPTYKRTGLLKKAIDSAIGQKDFLDYEIIVVDDNPERYCETENLMAAYKSNNLGYYKNSENLGLFGNWNRCIELAKSDYITNLNDDDILHDNYLKNVWSIMSKNSNISAVVVNYDVIDIKDKITSTKNVKRPVMSRVKPFDMFFGNINHGSLGILFLRENLLKIKGYNNKYYPSADYITHLIYIVTFKNVFFLNKTLVSARYALNESYKLETMKGFIELDKIGKEIFTIIYPKLKFIIQLSGPVFEYKNYKLYSNFSKEFKELHYSKMSILKLKIRFKNKVSFYVLLIIKKLLATKNQWLS